MTEVELEIPELEPSVQLVLTDEILYIDSETQGILGKLVLDTLQYFSYPFSFPREHQVQELRESIKSHVKSIQSMWLKEVQRGRSVCLGDLEIGSFLKKDNEAIQLIMV